MRQLVACFAGLSALVAALELIDVLPGHPIAWAVLVAGSALFLLATYSAIVDRQVRRQTKL